MNKRLAAMLAELAEDFDIEAKVYENYSGRGMMGNTTTGLVLSDAINDLPFLMYNCAGSIHKLQEAGELPFELDEPFRTDSLGRDSIVY